MTDAEVALVAHLAVTDAEVALVAIDRGKLTDVLARAPRGTVTSAAVGGGMLNTPITIEFADGGQWRFEVSRLVKKKAQAVVDVLQA